MGHDGHDHHHHHHDHSSPADEHRAAAPVSVSVFVVTCSDTRTVSDDASGKEIIHQLEHGGHTCAGHRIVKDDAGQIRAALDEALAAGARAVIFNGGTGISRRDVTFETLRALFEKELPGFGELFRSLSYAQVGSAAMLSRAAAGTVKGAVVFTLPGSTKAVSLAMSKLINPELGHLVRELLK